MTQAQIIHFPVDKRMPRRVAEEKVGSMTMFRCPTNKAGIDAEEWIEAWIGSKSVLLGWEPVKEGVVKSFKGGRVRHLVSYVEIDGDPNKGRPKVETQCGVDLHHVFNWESKEKVKGVPVVILGIDQTQYFRVCKHCLSRNRGRG